MVPSIRKAVEMVRFFMPRFPSSISMAFRTSAIIGLLIGPFGLGLSHGQIKQAENLTVNGELRVAFIMSNSALIKRSRDGQFSGVLMDLATALATKFGAKLHPIPYDNVEKYNRSIGKNEWDIAMAPRDLSRIDRLGYSKPVLVIDNGYVRRPGSSLISTDEVDRAGVKVAVAEHSQTDGFLTRSLKNATIIRLPRGVEEVRQTLAVGSADVYADNIHVLALIASELPGAMILVGRFNAAPMNLAVPKDNAGSLPVLNNFIQESKHDGQIADAIKRGGLQGVRIAR